MNNLLKVNQEKEIDTRSPLQPKRLQFGENEEEKDRVSNEVISSGSENEDIELKLGENGDLIKMINIEHKDELKEKENSASENINSETSSVANSSFFTVCKAPSISCKKHGSRYINVDGSTFKLYCQRCHDQGSKKCKLEMAEENVSNGIPINSKKEKDAKDSNKLLNSLNSEEEILCDNHQTQKGVFFCEDCKHFLCKTCFASSHRNHKSNLPSYAAASFKDFIKEIIKHVSAIKPKLDESLDEITKTNQKLKSLRDSPSKSLKEAVDKISKMGKTKLDELQEDFEKIFKNLDVEVENMNNRITGLSKRTVKYISEVNELLRVISTKTDSVGICEIKQNKEKLMKEIKSTLEDSKNFVNFKTAKIKKEVEDKTEEINKEAKSFFKKVKIFENSVITSITSGMKNFSLSMRRFTKFTRRGLGYYKTSSVQLKVCSPIFISAIGLCGLYISSSKLSNPKSPVYTDIKERGQIPIEIKITELREGSNEVKLSELHTLYGVLNNKDPTYLIHLKKAVFLKAETQYMISVSNLDGNSYVDMWTGEVNKSAMANYEQDIKCNCTRTEFIFYPAKGVESDFNEFNAGIVASIIFAKND